MRTAGLVRREGVIASRIKLALVAARCLDHRRQHGVYPETLSEVVSASEAGDPLSERDFSLVSENGALSIVSPANGAVSWKLPE